MKTALVTGATGGIGRAIALKLRSNGLYVIALGRNRDALSVLAGEHGIEVVALDVNDRAGMTAALAGRHIDVLVNNAGVLPPLTAFQNSAQEDIDRTIMTNVSSVMFLTRLLVPDMCERGSGHVFFTGSTAGHAPFPNFATYCASKSAIAGFAGALRLDLARFGVRVTEIVAGRVETGLYKDLLPDDARAAMYANNSAVQPDNVAAMVQAVLNMPQHVDVARFDILPTHQATATGQTKG
jgi:3-hydroxy acid dehydrogenase / malonic semialdehyde reductase